MCAVRIPGARERPSVSAIRVAVRPPSPPRPVRSAATGGFMTATDPSAVEESWSLKKRYAVETPSEEQHTPLFQVTPPSSRAVG